MNFRVFSVVVGSLLVPSISLADFVYSGIEVSYVDVEFNNGLADLDGDGYRFEGSVEMGESWFLLGEWEDQSYDFGIDGTYWEVGGGFHHSFSDTLDFVGTASWVNAEVELGPFSGDDDGLALAGGVRTRMADSFEFEALLQWVDFDQGGSDTGIELRGRYYFTDRFAFSLETDLDDDVDTLSFGFRAEF